MGDPLPLAFLVTGALTLLGIAVTLMLWRTVHGQQEESHGKDPRIKELLEELSSQENVRINKEQPKDHESALQHFNVAMKKNEEKEAIGAACALVALGQAQELHQEYLKDHRGPVDSHLWKRLPDSLLRHHVFSPQQDPSLDALAALVATAFKNPSVSSLSAHGLDDSKLCATPEEGPEVVLTLTRCANAIGLDLPATYVDEDSSTGLELLSISSKLDSRLLIRVGKKASSLTSTGQRSFLCGATVCRLHPAHLITLLSESSTQLYHLYCETRLFVDETAETAGIPSTSGLLVASTLSRHTTSILDIIQGRGGWPTEKETSHWWESTRETCLRMGLVFAGDIREIPISELPRRTLENLVGFFLSEGYNQTRYHLLGS